MNSHEPLLATHLPGTPRPQGSIKFHTTPNGKNVTRYSNTTINHRNLTVGQLQAAWGPNTPPLTTPVSVSLTFNFARPKSHYRTGKFQDELKASAPTLHDRTPDVDKLVRLMLDALTIAGVIKDDSQVFAVRGEKIWIDRHAHGNTYLQLWDHQ